MSRLIAEAEYDVANALGYWPAPQWIADERQRYPKPHDRGVVGYGYGAGGRKKALQANWGYVLYGGVRATTLLSTVGWFGVDADGDGFEELAQFEITIPAGTDPCEIRAYLSEYESYFIVYSDGRTDPSSTGADPAWEIRPLHIRQVSATTLIIWVSKWELLKPQLQEALNAEPIDADDPENYVTQLDFYRVYNDPGTQVQFLWGEDIYCTDTDGCSWSTQDGCLRVRQSRNGLIVPWPGTYNSVTGVYSEGSWAHTVEPDGLRLWYRAGWQPERAHDCQSLSTYWAKTIAMLATARLEWPLCTCTNVELIADSWRETITKITRERSFMVSPSDLENPFGIRVGEILAWKRIMKGRDKPRGKAVLT